MCTLLAATLGLLWPSRGHAEPLGEVSQWGITWVFDSPHECGTFAYGDYWVVGPVTITAITPDYQQYDFYEFTEAQTQGQVIKWINGWQVNPTYDQGQGFDETLLEFDGALVPTLPYEAQPGESIVKIVSDTDPASQTVNYQPPDPLMTSINAPLTAAVLTVVDAPPPDDGATVFRPPYVGTDKPYYSVTDLRTELLASVAPVESTPTLAETLEWVQRLQMDHKGGPAGAMLRPKLNLGTYQPYNGVRDVRVALRLMLDDPLDDKRATLIAFVQYGIDEYHIILGGQTWPDGYGVEPGHKLPIAFAATLLDHEGMKDVAGTSRIFDEDANMTLSELGRTVWGSVDPYNFDQEYSFWNYVIEPPTYNNGSARDPYGYIDIGMNQHLFSEGYQHCCISQAYKGEALVGLLMPELQSVWNQPEFFQYADRWVDTGVLAQTDPCAPARGTWQGGPQNGQACTTAQDAEVEDDGVCVVDATGYGVSYGPDPDRPGCCILDHDASDGTGRFPTRHGALANGSVADPFQDHTYRSAFADYLWLAYRAGLGLAAPSLSPAPGTFEGAVDVMLAPSPASYQVTLRYTTDGTDPTESSPEVQGRIRLTESAVVKARAFHATNDPSAVTEGSYEISADSTPPTVARVVTRRDPGSLAVVYDELIDPVSATTPSNYTLDSGLTIMAAAVGDDGASIVLTTSPMEPDASYMLAIRNVTDAAGNPIAADTTEPFVYWDFDPFLGLTGFWPFPEDPSHVADNLTCYHFGSNALVSGATAAAGRVGQGMSFALPTDFVRLGDGFNSFGMDTSNAFTIAFWVNIADHSSAEDGIFERTDEYGPCPFAIRVTDAGVIRTFVGDTWLDSTATLVDGEWTHLALTYDGAVRTLYVDGVEDPSSAAELVTDLYFPNTRNTELGPGFIGTIDEVRLYDRALPASKIQYLIDDTTGYTSCPYRGACEPSSGSGGTGAGGSAGGGTDGASSGESSEDSGCGCRWVGRRTGGAAPLLGLGLALALCRRARRRPGAPRART